MPPAKPATKATTITRICFMPPHSPCCEFLAHDDAWGLSGVQRQSVLSQVENGGGVGKTDGTDLQFVIQFRPIGRREQEINIVGDFSQLFLVEGTPELYTL